MLGRETEMLLEGLAEGIGGGIAEILGNLSHLGSVRKLRYGRVHSPSVKIPLGTFSVFCGKASAYVFPTVSDASAKLVRTEGKILQGVNIPPGSVGHRIRGDAPSLQRREDQLENGKDPFGRLRMDVLAPKSHPVGKDGSVFYGDLQKLCDGGSCGNMCVGVQKLVFRIVVKRTGNVDGGQIKKSFLQSDPFASLLTVGLTVKDIVQSGQVYRNVPIDPVVVGIGFICHK
jgi:hypothetical protein